MMINELYYQLLSQVLKDSVQLMCDLPSFLLLWRNSPQWAKASSLSRIRDCTQTQHTLGKTPLDKRSARRRDLYLTTHITHNREISMPPVGFEPTIPASERPQTHALDRAATGIDIYLL